MRFRVRPRLPGVSSPATATVRRSVCAPTAIAFVRHADPNGKWIMIARTCKDRRLAVEALEARSMMSVVAFGDFNNDGRMDKAEVTNPTTITVSLLNADGSYTVSATLTSTKNRPIADVFVADSNHDGKLDIVGGSGSGGPKFSANTWLGNGDGTFGNRQTQNSHPHTHGGV